METNNQPEPRSPDSHIWQAALKQGEREVLKYDPQAVRKALHDAREQRGHRVPKRLQAILP